MSGIWSWLAIFNGIVFLVYGLDKWKARHHRWRISESTLLWLAFLGGAGGATLAIYGVRHKSRKRRFALGVPLMLALQILAAVWISARF